jgi:WD40 repeat protein/serine/threonine protein kinase
MKENAMSDSGIFKAAVKLPADQRAAYLDRACDADPELRREVESLLRAHDASCSFLQDGPSRARTTEEYEPITEGPGTVIGPYKLMEQIDEGGMGLVFVAEQQEPVRRRVALKLIKPGMDSRQVIARFEAERQALAMMDHPNIARVFDAGTTASGRPYFVMELVHGVSIIAYCDANQLAPRERLKLFVPVCQAIQHAHQKGIIHRDIKPSNILVTMYDDKAVPKVIDFGVAKAIDQRLTEKTVYTRFGTLIGTLEYMSPEQAEMNAFGVDTRSDIYSLGVLLYELLTGTTPLERTRLRDAAFVEIVRIIKEEEPPRPSVRLSTSGALAKTAAARKTDPAKLSKLVRGELDWVAMKCLEKNRTRRYESASSLARDVERYLKGEPLLDARPPSTWYRFSKLARRNKAALTMAAAVAAALILGTGVSIWQAIRAFDQKRVAEDATEQAVERGNELVALNDKLGWMSYFSDMNLVWHAYEDNNFGFARELLDRHRPKPEGIDRRGFEWYYLHRRFHSYLRTIKAHTSYATTVDWMPDGKRIISVGMRESQPFSDARDKLPSDVKLWDATTGEQLPFQLKGWTDVVLKGAISPDGKRFATACWDKTIRVWDLETRKLRTLEGHKRPLIFGVAFSADSKRLVSWAVPKYDPDKSRQDLGEIKVWELAGGEAIMSLDRPASDLTIPGLSPDGKRLACVAEKGVLNVWDVATRREAFVPENQQGPVSAVAFSPDGMELAAICGNEVRIWEAATGKPVRTFAGEFSSSAYSALTYLAYSRDGKRLTTGTRGGNWVKLWDAATGRLLQTIRSPDVRGIALSPDGTRLAIGGGDGSVKIWDAARDPDITPIPLERSELLKDDEGFWLSPHGNLLLTGKKKNRVRLWDTTTGKPFGDPLAHEGEMTNVDYSYDGRWLALADTAKQVKIWDLSSGKLVRTFKDQNEPITDIAISPNSKWLAVAEHGGTLKIWDIDNGTEIRTIKDFKDDLISLHFSPDGARLLGAAQEGSLTIWDVATGRRTLTKSYPDIYIRLVRFSPDGKLLAVVVLPRVAFGEVRLLDAETCDEILRLKGHNNLVGNVDFSPDGKRLASSGMDSTVRVWDLASGQETLRLKGHTGNVTSVEFSSDGHRLISAATDGTVRFWDATPLPEDRE